MSQSSARHATRRSDNICTRCGRAAATEMWRKEGRHSSGKQLEAPDSDPRRLGLLFFFALPSLTLSQGGHCEATSSRSHAFFYGKWVRIALPPCSPAGPLSYTHSSPAEHGLAPERSESGGGSTCPGSSCAFLGVVEPHVDEPRLTWDKEVHSASGFKRAGRHSEPHETTMDGEEDAQGVQVSPEPPHHTGLPRMRSQPAGDIQTISLPGGPTASYQPRGGAAAQHRGCERS
jgi:hypothetical protein